MENKIDMLNNVICESEYKERVSLVFNKVADILKSTYGPYGCNTVIQKKTDVMFTKDGHQTMKYINFRDDIQQTIMDLLFKIATQVAIKVGDGTTTATIAADQLLKFMNENEEIKSMRSKDFMDLLSSVVDEICDKIRENATEINKDGDLNEIYKLAHVATNGDTTIPEIIRYIYLQTSNPAIEYNKAKGAETNYEIIEGYKMQFMKYIDKIFVNSDDGTCAIKEPEILMFDHGIEQEYYDKIIKPALDKTVQKNKRLVVIAPFYDSHLLQTFRRTLVHEFKFTQSTSAVYVRCGLINNHYNNLYEDFGALVGAQIMTEQVAADILEDKIKYDPEEFIGRVDTIVIGENSTTISGFSNKDENMFKLLHDDAVNKYNEVMEASEKSAHITDALINAKQRLAKMHCRMGVINVGGFTELEKSANYDLVEDAVKACESAYLYGYVPGQSTAIRKAISELAIRLNMSDGDTEQINKYNMLEIIDNAFVGVVQVLINNKYKNNPVSFDDTKTQCNSAMVYGGVIDITNDNKLNKDVINSCMTDIEVLKATTSIIGLLLGSNQFISI